MFQASKGLLEEAMGTEVLGPKLFELAQTGDSPAMNWNYRDEEAGGTLARMARSQWWAAESLEC